ncbi:DUF1801 domain-containing protein [uncultured Cyclobacterium sp.]|uniref:iron chaperone n=1 Tax=uncultured Cyclobacterium sp. TaxID=453820 RepID=UPI0030EB5557|tara:strand:- start:15242 stop:15601 length:360 start_codon:yes stop_codon:yes gene_type:complete
MKGAQNIDDYIMEFPQDLVKKLQDLRAIIKDNCPLEVEECLNYKMPTFKLYGNLVHFAAYKNHIGFYPTPSAIEVFKIQLTNYSYSKGAIQFPLDKPLPFQLIADIVQYRVKENTSKKK